MKTEKNTPSSTSFPVLYSSVSGKKERLAVEAEWHDYDELIYFQEGEFQLYVNLKEKLIKEECLYFIPRGCFHSPSPSLYKISHATRVTLVKNNGYVPLTKHSHYFNIGKCFYPENCGGIAKSKNYSSSFT